MNDNKSVIIKRYKYLLQPKIKKKLNVIQRKEPIAEDNTINFMQLYFHQYFIKLFRA